MLRLFVHLFVHWQFCKHNILKTSKLTSLQISTRGGLEVEGQGHRKPK